MEIRYHVIWCCIGMMAGLWQAFYAIAHNQLQTAFHHRVATSKNDASASVHFLELGKLILSFQHEPVIDVKVGPHEEKETRERTFFFPLTDIQGPECQEMIKKIQEQQSPFYTVSFLVTTTPTPGLLCTVRYDGAVVGMTYAVLEAGGQQRRLIITFYNKSLIRKIDDSHAQILQTAARKAQPGVIIDCGHGGGDSGAQGHYGLIEKDINLEIGILLASMLRKRGFDVFLTRTADVFVALDERTLMNERNSDAVVFVSIHANAAPNKDATGIETFFFDVEKSCPVGKVRPDTTIALMRDRSLASEMLARCIHEQVVTQIRNQQVAVIDRQVKPAFLQVLTGAAIPAALIELGFLTNEKEAALMKDKQYRNLLVTGLCEGIVQFFKQRVV
jgi:N-acetylmuramoyl-L-alanine amidase